MGRKKADPLAKLKIQRDVLLAKVASNIKRGETAIESQGLDEVELTKEQLLDNKKQLGRLNDEIFDLTVEDEVNSECVAAAEHESSVTEAISKLSLFIKRASSSVINAERPSSPVVMQPNGPESTPGGSVKLPKLDIEKFSGDPLAWTEFWDGFRSTIHDNNKLADVDKFKYLKHYVHGDALQMLKGYELTAANYTYVVDALEQRFGRKDVIINAHFDALQSLPEATHETKSLYAVFDKCELHIRSLAALGVSEAVFEQVFVPQILKKLPKFVRLEIVRRNGNKPWQMSTLREYIREEIYIRDIASPSQPSNDRSQKNKQGGLAGRNSGNGSGSSEKGSTADALVAGSANKPRFTRPEVNPTCPFCEGDHFADQCTKYADSDARRSKIKGRCFKCLGQMHVAKNCKKRPRKCYHCESFGHHRSLCNKKFGRPGRQENSSVVNGENGTNTGELDPNAREFVPSCSISTRNGRAIMQTALAEVVGNNGKKVQARLMFDTASSRTFVTKSTCRAVKPLKLGKDTIFLSAFGDEERRCMHYDIVELKVRGHDGKMITIDACATENITCPIKNAKLDAEKLPILKQLTLAEPLKEDNDVMSIDILIGGDFYYDFVGAGRIQLDSGIILLESKLGFIVTGRENSALDTNCTVQDTALLITHESNAGIGLDMEKFWRLEEIGIKDKAEQLDDERALELFDATVDFKDGRYAVAWPWKHSKYVLPSNKKLAFAQLQSNLRTLKKDENLLTQYHEVIQDQAKKGIIEVVSPETDVQDGQGIHYLKHHCVVNPHSETTKVRVVHNASAKARGQSLSLNECLYQGPVIMEDLCGILMRFRIWPIGIVSDIEKAFLQIEILPSERDVVRFLWVKDLSRPPVGDNVVHYRFTRVLFGIVASSFLLAATIQHLLAKQDTRVSRVIAGNTYIDNIIAGANSLENAKEYYDEAKSIFSSCSMNLRQWFTNDPSLSGYIPEKDKGKSETPKVLGMSWNLAEDTLSCPKMKVEIDSSEINTKRQALRALARVYDPCGFFAPITVTGKILIQTIWTTELDWDDVLPDEIAQLWQRYAEDLKQIQDIRLQRWIGANVEDDSTNVQLHAFCDASKAAYNAVVYIRTQTSVRVTTTLLFAKTRVKPLKPMTIPRLELLAVLVGVRLISFIEKELRIRIDAKYVWSDSLCVLQWLQKDAKKPMPVFIENRLREIRKAQGITFRHVRSGDNPADLGSRGCSVADLCSSELWWSGPWFLTSPEKDWPEEKRLGGVAKGDPKAPCDDECEVFEIQCEDRIIQNRSESLDSIIEVKRYSKLSKLLRVTATVIRVFKKQRSAYITATDIQEALRRWILSVQSTVQATITTNKGALKQLQPFVSSEGYVRCRGRLQHAELPENTKHPILLPKEHPFTRLVILEAHERIGHAGVTHTLSQLRANYWVPQGRLAVKSVLNDCRICRRHKAKPYTIPEQPALPDFRVQRCDPFQRVGIDYMGPLYVKSEKDETESEKVWICLFTCATIRAIHLEVVTRLDTESFLLSLRRFVAKYGRPDLIICDNAPNFHLAERTMEEWWKELSEDEKMHSFAASNRIEWKFVTELAPWMGGFYERMIQMVKICLVKILGKAKVSYIELETLVAEIAAMINTRPLINIDDDLSSECLTPSHFLCQRQKEIIPSAEGIDDEYQPMRTSTHEMILAWKRTQTMLNNYWKIWHQNYLTGLRERWRQKKQRNTKDVAPAIGTVVLIKDPGLTRGKWRLGKITQMHESFDGQIRSVTLKTMSGYLHRPIKLLAPLEFSDDVSSVEAQCDMKEKPTSRPQREAAKVARVRFKRQLVEESE